MNDYNEQFEVLIDKIINECSENISRRIFMDMIERLKEVMG